MLVVLDTNVLLSAFLWRKGLKPIYEAIKNGRITPCFTEATWSEFLRALNYRKFAKQLKKINIVPEEIVKLLSTRASFTTAHWEIREIRDDPSDNNLLACALSSGASFIASGDKHLLKLKSFQRIPIIKPRDFISFLRASLR